MSHRRFSGKNIHQWVKDLPIGHLQLEGHSTAAHLKTSTIGKLLEAVEGGALSRSSPTAVAKVNHILNALIRTVADGRPDHWDRFRKARPPLRSYKAIYFASPRLSGLDARESNSAVAKLHLSPRACNALRSVRITTIGELVKRAKRGIVDLAGLGRFKGLEVIASLDALSDAARRDGSIDWIKFAQIRGFTILPRNTSAMTPHQFIREFPRLCESAVSSTFNKNGMRVLKAHLLRRASAYVPRTKTGKVLTLNRETVRLYENEIVRALRSVIWHEEYCGCRFRFRPEFVAPLLELRACLKKSSPNANSWAAALRECWGVARGAISDQEILLLRLLGRDAPSLRRQSQAIRHARNEVRRFVASNRTKSFTASEVSQHLVGKLGSLAPTRDEVLAMLEGLPNLERKAESDSFVVSLNRLTYTDRCEVILRARGAPMHRKELTSAIAAGRCDRKCRSAPLTAALLSVSQRFVPVGRTGYWALREWQNVETRTIADIAAELLASSHQPLREIELFKLIKTRRRIGRSSLCFLLRSDRRFIRVKRGTWALKNKAV